ncbi:MULTISPECIES: hypothetical protein [Lacrimispora]|uniref:hypothetical protein n=1 Tax=Lacrimispora TaxID=2719231 RepID=UPI000A5E6B9D|nr:MULTISPECIES: hypothetical protein [Lacrimispora]
MVKSEATIDMSRLELIGIQENLEDADYSEIKRFRESFDPDDMGFSGRREGI